MAELRTLSEVPADAGPGCCSPAAQETCCEPDAKGACCGPEHEAGTCGCSAGPSPDSAQRRISTSSTQALATAPAIAKMIPAAIQ